MRRLTVVLAALVACGFPHSSHAGSPGADRQERTRGTPRGDVLRGSGRADVLHGRAGDDRLFGGRGADRLFGGVGHDTLHGQAESDSLSGGAGRDSLFGGGDVDTLRGGPGNDLLHGGGGKDRIFCGPGLDVVLSPADDRLAADCEQRRKAEDDAAWSWWDLWEAAWLLALVLATLVATATLVRRLLGPPPIWAGEPEERPAAPSAWLPFALPVPILGVLGVALYTLTVADVSAFAAAVLVAVGVYLVGGLFGFLFGIPKSLTREATTATTASSTTTSESAAADAARRRRFNPNTNLEEISDWLTKIIVGLTLVQFRELIDQIRRLAEFLAPSIGNDPSTPSFAIAVFMVFSISGFLTLYAATRLYGGEFSRAEAASKVGEEKAQELRERKPETQAKADNLRREFEA